jgi:hypothetical protein
MMNVSPKFGLLLICLLAWHGCHRTDPGEYRPFSELDHPADNGADHPEPSPADTEPDPSGPIEPQLAIADPEPAAPEDAPEPAPDGGRGEAPGRPPSPPLPEQLAAIVPPERTQKSAAERRAEEEVARMRVQILGDSETRESESGKPRTIRLLVPEKEFSREGPEKAFRVTFDDIDLLKILNMEPVPPDVMDHLPDWLTALDGERIILRGWMYPPGRQEGISRFMFVRDNGICCFGREPKVYDKLGVTLKEGHATRYIEGRPFDVIGTLTIDADVVGDEVFWLYHLDDAVVMDK